jgi:UDP-glucuronate 4-epimerase
LINSKAILVTGGAGFIGSHLCERLVSHGHKIICLDNFNDYYDPSLKERNISSIIDHPNFSLVRGDILDSQLLGELFPRLARWGNGARSLPVVVHLAALAGVRPSLSSPIAYVDVDVKGTVNLLESAHLHDVQQFIYASSSSVYGVGIPTPYREDQFLEKQTSPYSTAKMCGELYCSTYHHLYSIPITIFRFFTVYGPRQRPEMAFHKFADLLNLGEMVPIYGDGTSARDYTYIDDIIDGIVAAIETPFSYEVINLGSDRPVRLLDMVQAIGEAMGITPKLQHLPQQLGEMPITWANISKAKKLLGYSPKVSLKDGLTRFVTWYREQHTTLEWMRQL